MHLCNGVAVNRMKLLNSQLDRGLQTLEWSLCSTDRVGICSNSPLVFSLLWLTSLVSAIIIIPVWNRTLCPCLSYEPVVAALKISYLDFCSMI